MKRKYVIFYWHLFSERDWTRFECDAMIGRGYDVHIIQLGAALEGLEFSNFARNAFVSITQAKTPRNKEEIVRTIETLGRQDLVLTLLPIRPNYLWLHLQLGSRNIPYVQLSLGRLPERLSCKVLFRRNKVAATKVFFQSFRHLAYRIKFHLRLIAAMRWDYFRVPAPILWGRAGCMRDLFATEGIHLWRSEIVELESFDVAWARQAQTAPVMLPEANYAVYVDESLYDHPDYTMTGIPAPVEQVSYYRALRQFFDIVESRFDLKVVIALHPKSSYPEDALADFFGDRLTASGKTPALVRRAHLVFLHNSTAISYAVLARRPIMFLTSNDIDRSWLRQELDIRSSWLNQPVVNIDETGSGADIPIPGVADEQSYLEFETHFLCAKNAKHGSPVEAVAERFESLSASWV